ncbi:unnamed protein product, partial [Laminaria digitata]
MLCLFFCLAPQVESRCVADSIWYFPLLEPWVDHVPVKADLSDLEEKIRWCRSHDEECRKMAACAGRIYETFVSKDAALDYVEMVRGCFRFVPARPTTP